MLSQLFISKQVLIKFPVLIPLHLSCRVQSSEKILNIGICHLIQPFHYIH